MKKNLIHPLILAFLAGGISCVTAAEKVATVTETVNEVDHGTSISAVTTPASVGTSLQDGDYLKTGAKSLAELELDNKTITRMGSNTIFNYSAAHNEIDLQSGTILFSKPKDGQQLNIKTAAVTAAVVGTTGFFQGGPKGYLFGIIEGHGHITSGGNAYVVGPGEILLVVPGHPPFLFSFNVPHMVKTSPLFHDFNSHLPNQSFIDQEIAAYLADEHRGFIQSANGPIVTYQPGGYTPNTDLLAFENALNSAGQQYGQKPPAPGSTPPMTDTHHPHGPPFWHPWWWNHPSHPGSPG